jgi:hypothetical protein
MRVKVDWRSVSKENYLKFCKKHPTITVSFEDWKDVLYSFNEGFRENILETGDKEKLPFGFGEFSIIKKKRKRIKIIDGVEYINLPIDWKKTKEKGKVIYNFNHHTEGYFFGWYWFKRTARFKHSDLWYFKTFRTTSRLITEYINKDVKYQHIYREWNLKTQ